MQIMVVHLHLPPKPVVCFWNFWTANMVWIHVYCLDFTTEIRHSIWLFLESGVPQGGILSTIIFVVYGSDKEFFLVSALLRDCSLCWDCWNGTDACTWLGPALKDIYFTLKCEVSPVKNKLFFLVLVCLSLSFLFVGLPRLFEGLVVWCLSLMMLWRWVGAVKGHFLWRQILLWNFKTFLCNKNKWGNDGKDGLLNGSKTGIEYELEKVKAKKRSKTCLASWIKWQKYRDKGYRKQTKRRT